MSDQHAVVAPSGLEITVNCNASLLLQRSVPELPETDEEAEGTAAHWVARRFVAGYGAELPVGAKFTSGGRQWTVDVDMYAGARMYERALGGYHQDNVIERPVDVRARIPECWGTPDYRRYFPDARLAYATCPEGIPAPRFNGGHIKLIRAGEYKYGHRYVEIFENYQVSAYAAGCIDEYGLDDTDPDLYVELVLVQPRSYHREGPVRIWRTRAVNLRPTIIRANDAAAHALEPGAKARTGSHCLDCKARHVCTVLQYNDARIVDYSHTPERVELEPLALGQEMAILEDAMTQLKARYTGLSAQAEALVRAGKAVPFYHMESGRTTLTYLENVDADELVSMGDLIGIELRKKLQRKDLVVTPTQAIQLGIDEAVMKAYAHRPPGKMVLARDESITARKVFSK